MDTQFWWAYDAAAAAVAAVIIYLSAKKGFSKTIFTTLGCIISLVFAITLSESASDAIYRSAVKSGNIKSVRRSLEDVQITSKFKVFLENQGYNITVNESRLQSILAESENMQDDLFKYACNINDKEVDEKEAFIQKVNSGFFDIFHEMLSHELPEYLLSDLSLMNDDSRLTQQAVQMVVRLEMIDDIPQETVDYLENTFIQNRASEICRFAAFSIIYILLMLVIRLFANIITAMLDIPSVGAAEQPLGAVMGIIRAGLFLIAAAAFVKFLVIIGDEKMMFFNQKSIDKTIVFKYIYNLKLINFSK